MVHAVVPAAELREYTLDVARKLVRTPGPVLALVKENLNQAEDDVERRRYLFAHEAENQIQSASAMTRTATTRHDATGRQSLTFKNVACRP